MGKANVIGAICSLALGALFLVSVLCPTVVRGQVTGSFTVGPVISQVSATNITQTSATISWQTSSNATSQVFYDTFACAYIYDYANNTTENTNLVTGHSMTLTGLSASTTYHYRVRSVSDGIESVSEDYSFTTKARTSSGGGGGFGGGGSSGSLSLETNLFGEKDSFRITSGGEILGRIEATTEDGILTIIIPEGTIALDQYGYRLWTLEAEINESLPPLPDDVYIIGLAYDFDPTGATFDPPITFTFTYDPSLIPEGVAEEELVVAVWDVNSNEWVAQDYTVYPDTNTIAVNVSHFSTFAILAYTQPADFTTSILIISPAEVDIGEPVTVSIVVTNIGGMSGNTEVDLAIDGVVIDSKDVALASGDSREVIFTVARDDPGTYSVSIGGRSGTFTVEEAEIPADFTTSRLIISPAEVDIGELVTISIVVTNIGGMSGNTEVDLAIDGVVIDSKDVALASGDSGEVIFTVARDNPATYSVSVGGKSGTFTVKEAEIPVPQPNWWLVGGIVAGCSMIIIITIMLVFSRREA